MTTNTHRNATATRKTRAPRLFYPNARITQFKPLIDVPLMIVEFLTDRGEQRYGVCSAHCANVRQYMTPKGSDKVVTCDIEVCTTRTVKIGKYEYWTIVSPLEHSEEGRVAYEAWVENKRRSYAPYTAKEKAILDYILASAPTRKPRKPQEPTSELDAAVELL